MWIESGKSCTFAKTFRNMRVLIINTSEKTGGAAIAARRLMESLHTAGTDVKMLVLHKESQSEQVIPVGKDWQKKCTFLWERLVIWTNNLFSRKNLFTVSIANTGFNVTKLPAFREADIIHLHWINQGMLSLNNIQEIFESASPLSGPCTICGNVPPSATMPIPAPSSKANAETAASCASQATTIWRTGYSRRNKNYSVMPAP